MEGMFLSKGIPYILLAFFGHMPPTSKGEYTHNVVRCFHAQERVQHTQTTNVCLCPLTLTYSQESIDQLFPVERHDNLLSQHACKN